MLRHLLPLLLVGLATADDVLELVDSDFDGKLADIETALVMFYAPWWAQYYCVRFVEVDWCSKFSCYREHSSSPISDGFDISPGAAIASV